MPPSHGSKRLALLRGRNRGGTSDYALSGIEDALVRYGLRAVDNDAYPVRLLARTLKRLRLQGALVHRSDIAYVVAMMGPQTFRTFPHGLVAEVIPYAFDCWPAGYDEWERFLRAHRVSTAFFSAHQSAERMGARIEGLDAIWLPEAIDPSPYRGDMPLAERPIDLLELGRRSEVFHQSITAHCARRGHEHLYQRDASNLIFSSRTAFLDGMARTKILACFPSSMTHPERSGDIETLTLRYLEGIASGCILLGRCPTELRTLFGYDPVIAADLDAPGDQIDTMLGMLESYAPLVARNTARLYEVGTWDHRITTMLSALDRRGYRTHAGAER
jgi:hypothetical protein